MDNGEHNDFELETADEKTLRRTEIEKAVEEASRKRRREQNHSRLLNFLIPKLSEEFLKSNSHEPHLCKHGAKNNRKALEVWVDTRLKEHPNQALVLTREFMLETLKELLDLIEEHRYS